ncbi:MAG: Bug family tripartite tricarboxylate transporter substrate binding protein [Lachnospirales bacterium]
MKKNLCKVLLGIAMITSLTSCNKNESTDNSAFTPTKTINWTITSSPGGGSDIFTRKISDIMTQEDLVNGQTIIVANKTDGSGEVGRNEIARLTKDADYNLLTFNSGDLMPMVINTKNRIENFRPIALMAVDKQLIFKGVNTQYESFVDAITAAKVGEKIIIGGSKGDDVATYEAMIAEIGLTSEQLTYVTYDSSGDAITAALGGHIEFVISKPAAASEYVDAGSLIPVLALSTERYTGNLSNAPILSEIGDYKDVEVPVWRSVVAPAEMSDAAVEYWSSVLGKVSETESWNNDYIDTYKLMPNYLDAHATTEYITNYQIEFIEENGIE